MNKVYVILTAHLGFETMLGICSTKSKTFDIVRQYEEREMPIEVYFKEWILDDFPTLN